jgi:hypothetical protein
MIRGAFDKKLACSVGIMPSDAESLPNRDCDERIKPEIDATVEIQKSNSAVIKLQSDPRPYGETKNNHVVKTNCSHVFPKNYVL